MDIIILAAGKGSRLRGNVKTLLKINGETLLDRICKTFPNDRKVVVVGYKSKEVVEVAEKYKCQIVYNPVWHSTDNAYSLYCALMAAGINDSYVINGDTIFDPEIIQKNEWKPDSVAVELKPVVPEEMQVKIEDGFVTGLKKNMDGDGEALFYCFSHYLLKKSLDDLKNNPRTHFENVINQHMGRLSPIFIAPYRAMEIDNWTDYAEARGMFEC